MSLSNQLQRQIVDCEKSESGYMLLAVVVMVTLALIALSVAAPIVARDLRRDKEVESKHRAEQYVRAVRLYYKKMGSYPPSIEALEKINNVRCLRQKYIDPLTGKSDWRLIHQPKTTIKIPFGQELSGLANGSLGSASGMSSGVGVPVGSSTSTINGASGLAAGFNGASTTSTTGGGLNGSEAGTSGSSNTSGNNGNSSSDTGMFGNNSGGVIYGVGTSRSGTSILSPNQQTTYEAWEFWYDPRIERLYGMAQPMGGGGIGSQSASSFGQSAITGQPNGLQGSVGSSVKTGTTGASTTPFPQ